MQDEDENADEEEEGDDDEDEDDEQGEEEEEQEDVDASPPRQVRKKPLKQLTLPWGPFLYKIKIFIKNIFFVKSLKIGSWGGFGPILDLDSNYA